MIIDAHQHYWQLDRGGYGWIGPHRPVLNRDHMPEDLAGSLITNGIARTIVVQSVPEVAETEFLLGLARDTPGIAGVVGWVDPETAEGAHDLMRMAQDPALVGVRAMAQPQPEADWLRRLIGSPVLKQLEAADLVLDLLVQPHHLAPALDLALAHPGVRMVVDHAAKPDPADLAAWEHGMERLAGCSNVSCKLSGLTACVSGPSLTQVTSTLVRLFGPARLIWGSDWPVLNETSTYRDWCATSRDLLADLLPPARAQIFGGVAERIYRLDRAGNLQTSKAD
ncbi:amidohydrolase family protein [Marinovum sp. 2_MG-2023]|uniref:amidohydrolase family protein n=1 Tax=unclassified Marinovum TaxID=2647166 RepID=UPI0026E3AEC6|nr:MULTISPECIES: amidohydrolase family protein [unclassified Marinovum]MDO6732355.1 amidohydrolase family protein [Marinovum sp. 2_MG-2023]MDO6781672.1 amidohydrolase family protein [Marinovum sp. 1_MG-2023]